MTDNKIKLKVPIPIKQENGNSIETTDLTLQRIKLKHIKLLPDSCFTGGTLAFRDIIPLIASLTGIDEAAADEIDLEDLEQVAEVLQTFLSQFLQTGEK